MYQLFTAANYPIAKMSDEDPRFIGVPLLTTQADFLKPAKVGDIITLITSISKWGTTSLVLSYRFVRGEDVLCTATQTRVWCYTEGTGEHEIIKPAPIPESFRADLSVDKQVCVRLVSS